MTGSSPSHAKMTEPHDRILSGRALPDDDSRIEASIRPQRLSDYIGQNRVKENMQIAVEAARSRGEALDHVLLYGPPGLGKTTLAQILANEMGSAIKVSAGPLLEKKGDLTAMLTSLDALAIFSSWTKFTASSRAWKKSSIPRWRIFASISSSARAPAPASIPIN